MTNAPKFENETVMRKKYLRWFMMTMDVLKITWVILEKL